MFSCCYSLDSVKKETELLAKEIVPVIIPVIESVIINEISPLLAPIISKEKLTVIVDDITSSIVKE